MLPPLIECFFSIWVFTDGSPLGVFLVFGVRANSLNINICYQNRIFNRHVLKVLTKNEMTGLRLVISLTSKIGI